MENIITNDDRIAMAEVDYIINHMNERYINKIPQNVLDFIAILKKKDMQIYVDPRIPLEKQNLKEFTLYFLMILNLKYWCNDERKKEILTMMENNQKKFDDRIYNIFDQAENIKGNGNQSNQSEDLSHPKKVIIANQEQFNEISAESNNSSEEVSSTTSSVFEQMKEETAIASQVNKNIFKRIINKIKSLLTKSKQ